MSDMSSGGATVRRAIAYLFIPVTLIGVGLYGLVAVPDVVTTKTVVEHTSLTFLVLVMFGGVAALLAALLWDMSRD